MFEVRLRELLKQDDTDIFVSPNFCSGTRMLRDDLEKKKSELLLQQISF